MDAGALADAVEDLEAVRCVPDGGGHQGQQLLAALLLGLLAGLLHGLEQGLLTRLRQLSVVPDLLGEPQQPSVVVHRRGVRARMGVHHEQVHGVGTDVQDSEPHGPSLQGQQTGPSVDAVISRIETTTASSSWSALR
jgi:hypothetical protein